MNLRFVEAFLWVAKLGSFRAASEKMHTTQAAISNRIATLETELGVKLFERDSKGVFLTYHGSELLPVAEQMQELQNRLKQIFGKNEEAAGTIRIGVIETIVHTWLPTFLSRLSLMYPHLTVELTSDLSPCLRDELFKGSQDCIIHTEEISMGAIENRKIASMEMRWVAASRLGLPQTPSTLKEFQAYPIISFHRQSVLYRGILQASQGCENLRINFFSSLAAMIDLTKTGYGISLLPVDVIRQEIAMGELSLLDIMPRPEPLAVFVSSRMEPAFPVLEKITKLAEQVCKEFLEGAPRNGATLPVN